MEITCISDLHGHYPILDGGDLLIVAGDLTARDTFEQHCDFKKWLYEQPYRKKVVIAGNHDNYFIGQPGDDLIFSSYNIENGQQKSYASYLCDSGTEFEGLKIWGCPYSLLFDEVNPKCTAFMGSEEELMAKYDLIPKDIDILISHTPPYGILDENYKNISCGSVSLRHSLHRIKPKILVCAHIHECGGKQIDLVITNIVNASIVNEYYQPVNNPVKITLKTY